MRFTFQDLSEGQFEDLIVFLYQRLLSISVRGFAKGPDRGPDVKFVGTTELHPSQAEPWVDATIRLFFGEIVEEVIDRKALLSVSPNPAGHLELKAEILVESGNATTADLGHTYRKLPCIAFDMLLLRAYLDDDKFPRFVYHDGVFESLDDRKKENLVEVIRRYAELGLQSVITLIDSDLPTRAEKRGSAFDESENVLRLHAESEQGRLFKMATW